MRLKVLWTPNGGRLVVAMPDRGVLIRCEQAIDTFVETIKRIGIEEVKALNMRAWRIPLISTTEYPQPHTQRKVGDYYIATNINPEGLATKFRQIADSLGIVLHAELFPSN